MALDFKQTSKKSHGKKGQPRHTKEYKEYDGRHMSTRKLLNRKYVGDWYNYPRVNMEAWLTKQLDRPINDVFSDFVKEFKKTYKGRKSPDEFFYSYVDREKTLNRPCNFYVAPKGFLCKYHRRNTWRNYRDRHLPPVSHVDYNQKVLKGFSMSGKGLGPRYIGKLWVTTKGFTKLVNVWAVALGKLSKDPHWFIQVNVEGCRKTFTGKVTHPIFGDIFLTYVYVAKLSDFQ